MSIHVISNSPSRDYTHPDDRTLINYDMTPGFKPFTILKAMFVNRYLTYRELSNDNGDENIISK